MTTKEQLNQNDTNSMMADLEKVKIMQKEILSLLDQIEEQRAEKDPVRAGTNVKRQPEHAEDFDVSSKAQLHTDSRKAKNETDKGARPRIKTTASSEVHGYKERFELSEEHAKYGKFLRRNFVPLNQDNRLSEKFGFSPMKGNVGIITSLVDKPEPEISILRALTPKNDGLKITTAQRDKGSAFVTVMKSDDEKQDHSDDLNKMSSGKSKPSVSSGLGSSVFQQGVDKAYGKELAQAKSIDKPTVTMSQRGNSHTTEGQRKRGVIENPSKDKRGIKNMEPIRPRSPLASNHPPESPVQSKSFQQHGQTLDAVASHPDSKNKVRSSKAENEGFGERVSGILTDVVAKSIASGESALSKESMKKMVKEAVTRIGLPQNGLVDHCVETYFDEVQRADGDIDYTKVIELFEQNPEKVKAVLQVPELKGIEEKSDIDVGKISVKTEKEFSKMQKTQDRSANHADADNSPPQDIDIASWMQFAEKERKDASRAVELREQGMDTLFLLDVSESMKGSAWVQATGFITNFLECLQGSSSLHDQAFEHVALVTFGGETRVHQHLTCDYLQIQRKLDVLKPSGPSPLLGGVIMLEAAILGASRIFVSNNYKIPPRVFLITDGKPTLSSLIGEKDSDKSTLTPKEREALLTIVLRIHSLKIRFYPVPVGFADRSLLQEIASLTEGSVVSSEDWKIQAAAFKNYQLASRLGAEGLNPLLTGSMSEADLQQCLDFLRTHDKKRKIKEKKGLPHLGSRIELYPIGTSGYGSGRIGTVTKHMENGNIGATWDYPDGDGDIRSELSALQVKHVDNPRVLMDELIAPGCRVRRGPDWHFPDQDGGAGNLGSVYKVNLNGIVKVRWDNSNTNSYRFGMDGKFDLEIVEVEPTAAHRTGAFKNNRVHKNRAVASKYSGDVKEERASPVTTYAPILSQTSAAGNLTKEETVVEINRRNKPPVVAPRQWFWQRGSEWKPFADDVNVVIEEKYQTNPNGTVVINIDNESYRVVLPKLYIANVITKMKHTIERR
ncbi:uncharacterized protein LOC127876647 isoform X2 [Dreissena polymorpha]|uniref:uncharacterized protein LOC127876647 isoform X2 n=1 Tax=Dreissena polymorpha TaxID=45954 RepID=UPI002264A02C|nr:uncharacterized protein LOC127876647 isoform X2 [Dreissena polymorpha]